MAEINSQKTRKQMTGSCSWPRDNHVRNAQHHSEPRGSRTLGSSTKVLAIQAGRRSAVPHERTT